jgi:hypothetical protein
MVYVIERLVMSNHPDRGALFWRGFRLCNCELIAAD